MNALIMVDIQNDFLPGGTLAVPEGDEIIPLVNRLQETFPLVVATQDWHPSGHKSFASQHTRKEPMDTGDVNGIEQILWPDHCVQETEGAEFANELKTTRVQAVIRKGLQPEVDSYSGFYDMNQEVSTGLTGYLREKEVDHVFICGLAADVCVKFTALDAIEEGFTTHVIEDAVRGVNVREDDVERAFEEMKNAGVHMLRSEELPR